VISVRVPGSAWAMKTPIGALALVLFLSTTALAADVPPYPAFTADTEMKAGGNTQTGKVAFGKGKMRMEMALGENTMVTIFDYGASKMYSLLPPPMGCMEQAIEKDPKDPLYATVIRRRRCASPPRSRGSRIRRCSGRRRT
jgi:hypothetical protein